MLRRVIIGGLWGYVFWICVCEFIEGVWFVFVIERFFDCCLGFVWCFVGVEVISSI